MKFKKKPVIIDAVQLKWTTWNEMCDFLGDIISKDNPARESKEYSDTCGESSPYIELTIPTLEGDHVAKHGDWVVKGVKGEFYPCKPDIFKETYEKVLKEEQKAFNYFSKRIKPILGNPLVDRNIQCLERESAKAMTRGQWPKSNF